MREDFEYLKYIETEEELNQEISNIVSGNLSSIVSSLRKISQTEFDIIVGLKPVLVKNKIIDRNYTKIFINKLLKVDSVLRGDPRDSRNIVYNIFMEYSKKPDLQHEIGKIIYASEIIHKSKDSMYVASPPFREKANNILQERIKHYDNYVNLAKKLFAKKNFGSINNIGINSSTKLSDIIPKKASKYVEQNRPFNFENNENIVKLLNCEKHLILAPKYGIDDKTIFKTSHFLGEFDGQKVVFVEKIDYPINKQIKESEPNIYESYELGFYVNGNPKKYVHLIRADFKPHRFHFNKTEGQYDTNVIREYKEKDFDQFDANLEYTLGTTEHNLCYYDEAKLESDKHLQETGNPIIPHSHIHITNNFSATILPTYTSSDVKYIADNDVFNMDYTKSKQYIANNGIRTIEGLYDFCDKLSEENIVNINGMCKFMRLITHINLKENDSKICIFGKELANYYRKNLKTIIVPSDEDVICKDFIQELDAIGANDFNLEKEYNKFKNSKNYFKQNLNEEGETYEF